MNSCVSLSRSVLPELFYVRNLLLNSKLHFAIHCSIDRASFKRFIVELDRVQEPNDDNIGILW